MNFDIRSRFPSNRSFPMNILSWIGRHELAVLLAFALIVGGIWLTIELAGEVVSGETEEVDLALLMMLREGGEVDNPIGPFWFESLMRDYTALGGTGILVIIVLAITTFYVIQGRYREMLFLLTAVIGATLLSVILKDVFGRPRPQFIPGGIFYASASFPSGHALLAAATYLTLGTILAELMPRNRLKAFVLLLAFFLMILVGFTRVYLGVHWPTDVLAGWTIGSVWATICWLVFRWLRRRAAAGNA